MWNKIKKERTFLEIIKLFIEPVKLRPLIHLKYSFVSFIWWLAWIVHILFLERITFYLQNSDNLGFNNILKYYIIFIITYELVNFSIRKWWWVETIPLWTSDLLNKYLNKYVTLDNNKIETIWTWKLIWIINNWINKWSEMIADFFEKWISLIMTFIFTIYMITKVDVLYGLLFIVLFIIFMIFSIYFNYRLIIFRKIRYENRNLRLKNVVKVLMNKQEIMQSNKIENETNLILKYSERLRLNNRAMWTFRTFMKRTPQLWISLMLLFSFYYLWNQILEWKMEMNIVIWLSGVLIIMQKSIIETVSFYVRVTKDFIDIEKLWDFFDNTPEMKWYNSWKDFEYKKWKIEIENLTYWYSKNKPVFKNFDLKLK